MTSPIMHRLIDAAQVVMASTELLVDSVKTGNIHSARRMVERSRKRLDELETLLDQIEKDYKLRKF